MDLPPPALAIRIAQIDGDQDLAAARDLMEEYFRAIALGAWERRAAELAALPGEYAPPRGRLLLAWSGHPGALQPAGCVALRPLAGDTCELRRLYVRPPFRGTGLGRTLVTTAIAAATAAGYDHLRLDTLPTMHAARALYHGLGFRDIAPYRDIEVPGILFLELDLQGVR
jgi:putative acetyltransferase